MPLADCLFFRQDLLQDHCRVHCLETPLLFWLYVCTYAHMRSWRLCYAWHLSILYHKGTPAWWFSGYWRTIGQAWVLIGCVVLPGLVASSRGLHAGGSCQVYLAVHVRTVPPSSVMPWWLPTGHSHRNVARSSSCWWRKASCQLMREEFYFLGKRENYLAGRVST